jgi:CRP/FNR family transcriptional regulator, cyclic AMP receptor protein
MTAILNPPPPKDADIRFYWGPLMPRKDKAADFDAHAFFQAMSRGRTVATCRPEEVIFSQGDRADGVYYIQSGKVKLSVTSASGKEAVVAVLGDGDFFGEGSLIAQPVRLATATALADCTLDRIDKTKMLRVLHEEPEFSDRFTAHLLTRNSRVEADLVDQLLNSSEKRLARTLLLLANFGKEGRPEPITTKISQETLAEMVGTTRPRISFFMNKFRKLGFIDYNGTLRVHSSLLSVLLRD